MHTGSGTVIKSSNRSPSQRCVGPLSMLPPPPAPLSRLWPNARVLHSEIEFFFEIMQEFPLLHRRWLWCRFWDSGWGTHGTHNICVFANMSGNCGHPYILLPWIPKGLGAQRCGMHGTHNIYVFAFMSGFAATNVTLSSEPQTFLGLWGIHECSGIDVFRIHRWPQLPNIYIRICICCVF